MEDEKKKIKAIDKTTVHRICSGQVVLNLATAVKELVENSIDAGATAVDVKLKDYGMELVEVTDNGHGVHPDNFEGLTLKHHTSKLRDFSDLIGVETYGFRGEALSSLCALSDLSVITRHKSLECGTELIFDRNGRILERKQCARQVGTTVSLANLFSSLPVRQKEFHKNIKREFNKMTQLLYAYCLVSTGIKITCTNQTSKGSKTTFVVTHGCKNVKENISCVFGSKQLNSLLEIKQCQPPEEILVELKLNSKDCDLFTLAGYVSSCAHGMGRNVADRQFYFINSRPCEPSKIIKVVNEIYHQFNVHQVPFVYLNVTVAKDSVDVNVTPDKRQIFLNHEKLLVAIVKASLLNTYKSVPSTFGMNNVPTKILSTSNDVKQSEKNVSTTKPNISLFNRWRSDADNKRRSEEVIIAEPKKCRYASKAQRETLNNEKPMQREKQTVLKTVKINNDPSQAQFQNKILTDSNNSTALFEVVVNATKSEDLVSRLTSTEKEDKKIKEIVDNNSNDKIKFNEIVDIDSQDSNFNSNKITDTFENGTDNTNCTTDEGISSQSTLEEDEFISSGVAEEITSQESGIGYFVSEEATKRPKYDTYFVRNKKVVVLPLNLEKIKDVIQRRDKKLNNENNKRPPPTCLRFRAAIDPSKNTQAELELSKEITKDMFAKMEIIGQFNLGFIISKLESDLFIIDQHATDEKYNFETLQKTTVISHQKLVVPQQLDLTAANENVLMDNIEIFRKNGFDFSIDENAPPTKRISLSAVPMSKNWVFGKEDVDELIFMLEDCPNTNCRPSRVRSMFASRACRKSVMIGSALTKQDMKRLVNHMGEIEHPWNCPHGRPTMRHLINLDLLRNGD